MPEIKNTFNQGKMNKDLDERIIPSGQYKDAMNVQVSTSDGSDVGTVQNIMGSNSIETAVGPGFKCVGTIADEKNNKFYWFVKSYYLDAILECTDENIINPIIIDTKANTADAVLKFTDNIITGINIIDNLLLWTDGVNEPRRINLDRCRKGNAPNFTSLNTSPPPPHTKLIVDDATVLERIEVKSNQTSTGAITDITFSNASKLKVGDDFVKIRNYNNNSPYRKITAINGNVVTLSSSILSTSYLGIGDLLTFTREEFITEDHITSIKKGPIKPLEVKINQASKKEKSPLFEKIFPRFSYRYTYVDGEYSTLAPFTDVVFKSMYTEDNNGFVYTQQTAYDTKEPYNSGMQNMISSVELSSFVGPDTPEDVVQIEILYKQEDSTNIYVVKKIKYTDKEWSAGSQNYNSRYKGKFLLKTENIHSAIPSNQLLRPWDNIPKKALAQEVTGNRVVYGNYTQNYTNDIPLKLFSEYEPRYLDGTTLKYHITSNLLTNGNFQNSQAGTGYAPSGFLAPDNWDLGNKFNYVSLSAESRVIALQSPSQGEMLKQRKVNELLTGYTYRITFDFKHTNWQFPEPGKIPGELEGRLVDNDGNYIEFSGVKGRAGNVGIRFEYEALLEEKTKVNASGNSVPDTRPMSERNSFYIKVSNGNNFSKVSGQIMNISVVGKIALLEDENFESGGLPSIKSQRNYQLGVVYGDKYGRETPVFTSENSSIKVPWGDKNASKSLRLKTHLTSLHPEWADYYKFYIKETSGEYYNLVMDAIYKVTKDDIEVDDHVWMSFPSSDRNKVSEDDYLIFKKKTDDVNQVLEENKYRVLDIKNEIPDAIKFRYIKLGEIANTSDGNELNGDQNADNPEETGIFYDLDKRPVVTLNNPAPQILEFKKSTWEQKGGQTLVNELNQPDLYFSFFKTIDTETVEKSKKYKVSGILLNDEGFYVVNLNEPINEQDAELIEDGSSNLIHADVTIRFEKKITKGTEAFSGRFFVKILSTNLSKNALESSSIIDVISTNIIHVQRGIRWLSDVVATATDPANGLLGQNFIDPGTSLKRANEILGHSGSNLTTTESDWDVLLKLEDNTRFFIDNMYFASAQLDFENGLARNSGPAYRGGNWSIPGDIIRGKKPAAGSDYKWTGVQDNVGDNLISFPNFNWMHPQNTGPDKSHLRNGVDGVVTTNSSHISKKGARRWRNSVHEKSTDGTYGKETGKNYLHISFLGPGVDLHNGNFPGGSVAPRTNGGMGYSPDGRNANPQLCANLQGIWGGGVFTGPYERVGKDDSQESYTVQHANEPTTLQHLSWTAYAGVHEVMYGDYLTLAEWMIANGDYTEETIHPGTEKGVGESYAVFMEGGATNKNKTGLWGYSENSNHKYRHDNQWKPWLPNGSYYEVIETFVKKLFSGGEFIFKNDPNKEVYKILKCTEKRLYNHTPWRKAYKNPQNTAFGGGDDLTFIEDNTGDSVEDAVIDWAFSRYDSQGFEDALGDQIKYDTMCDRITQFGQRNNRRVCYILELDKDIRDGASYNPVNGATLDAETYNNIQFITEDVDVDEAVISQNPAIWETEPKENVDLDIYYETGQAYPTKITDKTQELFAPIGCEVEFIDNPAAIEGGPYSKDPSGEDAGATLNPIYLTSWIGPNEFTLSENINAKKGKLVDEIIEYVGKRVRFTKQNGAYTTGIIASVADNNVYGGPEQANIVKIDSITLAPEPGSQTGLGWYNSFSFGNGIESNRIRDDFNAMTITNGVKASTTLETDYKEEHRKSGLIYSGLYNSTSGTNNLNQFIAAEKITKDLNPTYGSIQKLFSRRISLIAFCEDRVIGITANKNALYNADGSPQLVASDAVLGDANPFVGDYGISKNPESFARESYRAYFTDKQRGAVLRLSMDGITPISDAGMHDYFRDNLKIANKLIGTYDAHKNDYNLTISDFLLKNVIANGRVDQGEEALVYYNTVNFIKNGTFTNGTPRHAPLLSHRTLNPDISNNVTLTYHRALTQGEFVPEINEVPISSLTHEVSSTVIYNVDFANPPTIVGADYPSPFGATTAVGHTGVAIPTTTGTLNPGGATSTTPTATGGGSYTT